MHVWTYLCTYRLPQSWNFKVESYITVLLFTELPLNTYVLYLFIYSFIHSFVYLWLDKCTCTVFFLLLLLRYALWFSIWMKCNNIHTFVSVLWCSNILGATADACLGQHTHNSIHREIFGLQMYLYLINLTFGKCVMQFRMNRNTTSRGLLHSVRKMLF